MNEHWPTYVGLFFSLLLTMLTVRSQTLSQRLHFSFANILVFLVFGGAYVAHHDTAVPTYAIGGMILLYHCSLTLIRSMENQLGFKINVNHSLGLVQCLPKNSGLLVFCILMMGATPGSLLLFSEDALFHRTFEHDLGISIGFSLTMLVTTLSLYGSCCRIMPLMSGARPFTRFETFSEPKHMIIRIALTLYVFISIFPRILGE